MAAISTGGPLAPRTQTGPRPDGPYPGTFQVPRDRERASRCIPAPCGMWLPNPSGPAVSAKPRRYGGLDHGRRTSRFLPNRKAQGCPWHSQRFAQRIGQRQKLLESDLAAEVASRAGQRRRRETLPDAPRRSPRACPLAPQPARPARTCEQGLMTRTRSNPDLRARQPDHRPEPGKGGAPERIRTSGLCLRRAALYPAELRVPMQPDSQVAAPSQEPCISDQGRGFRGRKTR